MTAWTTLESSYGPSPVQAGDLLLPGVANAPVLCLLHGGFWRAPHGREQWNAVAVDLVRRGFAVWNLGYRRLGDPGGGWRGTFDDVVRGILHLRELASEAPLDLRRVSIIGHSAGGHLALWAATRLNAPAAAAGMQAMEIRSVAALAPVADLARAWELGLGNGAVEALLGGSPAEFPDRYAYVAVGRGQARRVRQAILHGTDDSAVPIEMSRAHVAAASAAGEDIGMHALTGAGHMDFLDPASAAHATLREWLAMASA